MNHLSQVEAINFNAVIIGIVSSINLHPYLYYQSFEAHILYAYHDISEDIDLDTVLIAQPFEADMAGLDQGIDLTHNTHYSFTDFDESQTASGTFNDLYKHSDSIKSFIAYITSTLSQPDIYSSAWFLSYLYNIAYSTSWDSSNVTTTLEQSQATQVPSGSGSEDEPYIYSGSLLTQSKTSSESFISSNLETFLLEQQGDLESGDSGFVTLLDQPESMETSGSSVISPD